MSVNVSGRQLVRPELEVDVGFALTRSGRPPGMRAMLAAAHSADAESARWRFAFADR